MFLEKYKHVAEFQEINEHKPVVDRSARKLGHRGDASGWLMPIRIPSRPYTPEYQHWRESVLLRDNYCCVFCGSPERLEVDHIQPWAIYPELRFDIENGRALCHNCHTQTETYGRRISKIISVKVEQS